MIRHDKLFFSGALVFLFVCGAAWAAGGAGASVGSRGSGQGAVQSPPRAGLTFVSAVAFSRDGRRLAARRSEGGDIDVWDFSAGRPVRTLPDGVPQSAKLAISPDGGVVASATGKSIKLWEAATGRELRVVEVDASGVAYGPDGRWLAAVNSNGVRLLDASTLAPAHNFDFGARTPGNKLSFNSITIAFSPDGRLLAAGSNRDIKIWDINSGRLTRTITRDERPPMPHHVVTLGGISSLCFSPDGRLVAAGGGAREARTWNVATGREVLAYSVNAVNSNVIGFGRDGKTLLTHEVFVGGGIHPVITVWDIAAARKIGSIPVSHAILDAVALVPDSDRLAVGAAEGVQVWDIPTQKLLTTLAAEGVGGQPFVKEVSR